MRRSCLAGLCSWCGVGYTGVVRIRRYLLHRAPPSQAAFWFSTPFYPETEQTCDSRSKRLMPSWALAGKVVLDLKAQPAAFQPGAACAVIIRPVDAQQAQQVVVFLLALSVDIVSGRPVLVIHSTAPVEFSSLCVFPVAG